LIFEHEHNAAIREGDWKLVGRNILGREGVRPQGRWELYNLGIDPPEQHSLTGEKPALVEEVSRLEMNTVAGGFVLQEP
jgi:arylsulfatase A-like enzyme